MKSKSKKTLIISVIALMLCVALALGATYAWFTDSVTSGTNKIVAGNLDIDVLVEDDNGEWVSIDGVKDSLFDKDALWEPGHTEYVTLKIVNKGTLALKYQFAMTPVSEDGGVNVDGESFKLSNYLQFGLKENGTTEPTYTADSKGRTDVRTLLGTNPTYGFAQNAMTQSDEVLKAEENENYSYVTLVVYMPEEVGNKANYKTGTNPPKIELGVTVTATQYTYEKDSFDEKYDENAAYVADEAVLEYNYFPQVNVTGQLKLVGSVVDRGDNAGSETSISSKNSDGSSTVVLASNDTVDSSNPAAKLTANVKMDGSATTGSMTLTVEKDDSENANFQSKIDTATQESTTYQVSVTSEGVTAVAPGTGKALYQVELFVGKNRTNLEMYHKGTAMTEATSGAPETYTYNATTGYVTIYVDSFSPFTAVYDQPVCAIGKTAYYTLADAFAAAKDNDTITLMKDIKQSNSIVVEKAITLDLNGKTITDKDWAGVSPTAEAFFYVKSGAAFTINDSVGTGEISTKTESIYSAVILTIKDNNDTGKTATLVVNGGTLCGYYYGIGTNGDRHNTDITVNGGTITASNTKDSTGIYHPCKGKLTITGGTIKGYDGLSVKGGTEVTITGGEFIATGDYVEPSAAQGSGINSVGSALYIEGNYGYGAKVNVSGGTFKATGTNSPAVLVMFNQDVKAALSITGGTFSSDPSEYLTDYYYALPSGDNYVVKQMTVDATTKKVTVMNATELTLFANKVNYGTSYEGWTIELGDNIDLKDVAWTPINDFKGTFDGKSMTISNLTVSGEKYVGLFGSVIGTIKDVTIKNANVTGVTYVGAVVGKLYGSVSGCTVDTATITANEDSNKGYGQKAGAIVGFMGEGSTSAKNNTVKDVTIKGYNALGGVAGCTYGDDIITGNTVNGLTITKLTSSEHNYGDYQKNLFGAVYGQVVCGENSEYTGGTLQDNTGTNVTLPDVEEE